MQSTSKSYIAIGSARDLENPRERILYRALEMLPGLLIWITFALIILGSLFFPYGAAIFIIIFDFYWLLKSVYMSLHIRASFRLMREYQSVDWIKKLDLLRILKRNWRNEIWHLIILPFYNEEYEIIKSTCDAILATRYPSEKIMLVLSGEKRRGDEAREIGEKIRREFDGRFGKFLFTMHEDKPGELAGKGSNETWAIRRAKEFLIDKMSIPYENIIVSVFDVDTIVSPQYFSRLTYLYLTVPRPLRTSFQPIPLFINNIWEAPAVARVIAFSSTFWHLMNQVRPERLTSFSSHAFPFKALVEMDFWQTNVVSEDSRIFWKGLLTFDGDWRVEPLLLPVSMDANVAETLGRTLKNTYLQQRRWAYGAENIPYFVYGFLHNKKISFRAKAYWSFHMIEGFWAWATNSIVIFVLGWLPVLLGGNLFATTVLAYNTPRLTRYILTFAMFGIITSIYLSLVLLPPRPLYYGRHRYLFMVLQWFFIPITLIIFGSFPAIEAQTRLMLGKYLGFWPTPKIRKGIQKEVFG